MFWLRNNKIIFRCALLTKYDVFECIRVVLAEQIAANIIRIFHLRKETSNLGQILFRGSSFEKPANQLKNSKWRPFFKIAAIDLQNFCFLRYIRLVLSYLNNTSIK